MILKLILTTLLIFSTIQAKNNTMFQSVSKKEATFLQKGELKPFCKHCGMHLVKFYKTSHSLNSKQFCSMHCLVKELQENPQAKDIKVVDVTTLKFINVSSATYVVGSKKKGTMTKNSKYAFAKKSDADAFAVKNGGKVVSYGEALKIAQEDFEKDMIMIGKKRSKMSKMGEKIYNTMCQKDKISALSFQGIGDLKAQIKKKSLCKGIKKKKLQAVAIYVASKDNHEHKSITLPEKSKCPVCGMFVAKYPKWVANIKEDDGQIYYFDGVKDMMKYYFDPVKFSHKKKDFIEILVSDYYTLHPIAAKNTWYVIGSNIYGPMGNELIPFKTEADAKAFFDEHSGKKIVKFDEITEDQVYILDQ